MGSDRLDTRPLVAGDAAATALIAGAGVHGAYVANALAEGRGTGFVFGAAGRERGLCWFGPRGNLVIAAADGADALAEPVAAAIRRTPAVWRIAMGPDAFVEALRSAIRTPPLVCREQLYYQGDRASHARALVRADVRAPERRDRERLARATLALNASDLNIAPERVDRRWLYDTIDERIADGSTRVLGPVGALWCKLDVGSDGPAGRIIEGVFTFPEVRGQGLCAALVASSLAAAPGAVSLHVAAHNRPARCAYEKAGMRVVASCRLLLLG